MTKGQEDGGPQGKREKLKWLNTADGRVLSRERTMGHVFCSK